MKKLFLDDERKPYDDTWDVVRSFDEFVAHIEKHGCPDVISFDHDLADEHYPRSVADLYQPIDYEQHTEKTGYDAARWLLEKELVPKLVVIHTHNPVGAQNIAFLFMPHFGICNVVTNRYDSHRPIRLVET